MTQTHLIVFNHKIKPTKIAKFCHNNKLNHRIGAEYAIHPVTEDTYIFAFISCVDDVFKFEGTRFNTITYMEPLLLSEDQEKEVKHWLLNRLA